MSEFEIIQNFLNENDQDITLIINTRNVYLQKALEGFKTSDKNAGNYILAYLFTKEIIKEYEKNL